MLLDVGRAGHQRPVDRADASRDQIRVLQVAEPDRAIVAFPDEIDDLVAVTGVDVEQWMAPRHVGDHRREMRRAQAQWRGNTQASAQLARWMDRFPGQVDLGTGPGRIVHEGRAGFRQRRATGRARQQLQPQLVFKTGEAAAHNRF